MEKTAGLLAAGIPNGGYIGDMLMVSVYNPSGSYSCSDDYWYISRSFGLNRATRHTAA